MSEEKELNEEELELETLEVETRLVEAEGELPDVVLSPEQVASRKLAHDIKVAKFLSGGKY